jgi:hypothetical protein
MKSSSTCAFVLGGLLSFPGVPALAVNPPEPVAVRLADFQGLSKVQAKRKFAALPDDAVLVLADGRKATKRELVAAANRKPKPDLASLAPSAGAALADASASLRAREKTKADASLRAVGAEFGQLTKRAAPTLVPCPVPSITAVFPFSDITPGGSALVTGCGFGDSPGEFLLVLSQTGVEVPLGSLQWSSTGVAGTIPADHPALKTAPSQPAALKVRRSNGGSARDVGYRAGHEVRQLPFSKVARTVSTESDDDRCYDWAGGPTGTCAHFTGPWDPAGGDIGTDTFSVHLKNGWTLHSWVLKRGAGSTNWFMTSHRDAGLSDAKNSVTWMTLCGDNCHCWYYLDVFVEGEIGTSPW